MFEVALLTESFYRILGWMLADIDWRRANPRPPYPKKRMALSTEIQCGRLSIQHNLDPRFTTYRYCFRYDLPNGISFRAFFFQDAGKWIISGADSTDPVLPREKDGDEFGGWFPEEIVTGLPVINDGASPDRAIGLKNLIES